MSDSLESIYLAAKADPHCDAYFIPIPYFDRNQDGSLGKIHYEAEGFYQSNMNLRTGAVIKRRNAVQMWFLL